MSLSLYTLNAEVKPGWSSVRVGLLLEMDFKGVGRNKGSTPYIPAFKVTLESDWPNGDNFAKT